MFLRKISPFVPVGRLRKTNSAMAYSKSPTDVRVEFVVVEMSCSVTMNASISLGIVSPAILLFVKSFV